MTQAPSLGRVVHYKINLQDAAAINQRRDDYEAHKAMTPRDAPGWPGATGHVAHVGNHVTAGDTFPADIVRVRGNTPGSAVNLQVKLDGTDTYWVTSTTEGDGPGHWIWPPRV